MRGNLDVMVHGPREVMGGHREGVKKKHLPLKSQTQRATVG